MRSARKSTPRSKRGRSATSPSRSASTSFSRCSTRCWARWTRATADADGGEWRRLSYAEAVLGARAIAQALIDRRLSAERPVAILSDNDLEHLLLSLGCMLAGVPYAPISPACSLLSQDHGKLKHILGV